MIIVQLLGGLGNQLNIYAFYLKMKSVQKEVKLDVFLYDDKCEFKGGGSVDRNLELPKMGLEYETCTLQEHWKHIDDNDNFVNKVRRAIFGRRDDVIMEEQCQDIYSLNDGYIIGSFSPIIYATVDILQMMRNTIKFIPSNNIKNIELMERINCTNAVSIHIRRTDYLEPQNQYLNIATEKYYDSAMNYIEEHCTNVEFYIFSDDKDYIRTHYIGEKYHIVDWNSGNDSIYDMQLMSLCKHNIAASSTFSHWAGRINNNAGKLVIVPVEVNFITYKRDADFIWINSEGKIVEHKEEVHV